MIINKTYEFNYIDIDSVILNIAKDIDAGFTFYKIERLSMEPCSYTRDLKPSIIVTLHNKKADDYERGRYKL